MTWKDVVVSSGSGEEIPLVARIICVADSFDAMNTNRVYRNKLTKEKIMDEIEKNKGLQFDPAIADIMLKLLKDDVIKIEQWTVSSINLKNHPHAGGFSALHIISRSW